MAKPVEGFNLESFGGLIEERKLDIVDPSILFNVADQDTTSQTSKFLILGKVNINDTGLSHCGDNAYDCDSTFSIDITADDPISVNHLIQGCRDYVPVNIALKLSEQVSRDWAYKEVAKTYNKQVPNFEELLVDAGLTAQEKIFEGIGNLVEKDFAEEELLVVVSKQLNNKLKADDLHCCNPEIQYRGTDELFNAKFGVNMVVLPKQYMANEDLLIYRKEQLVFKRFCVDLPQIYTTGNTPSIKVGNQFIQGEEYIGSELFEIDDVNPALVVREGTEEPEGL